MYTGTLLHLTNIYTPDSSLSKLSCRMWFLTSYIILDGTLRTTVFRGILAGFTIFVVSTIAKYRRGLQVFLFISKVSRTDALDRLLAACQVCVFRSIRC